MTDMAVERIADDLARGERREPPVAGRRDLAVVLAAYRSIAEGRAIRPAAGVRAGVRHNIPALTNMPTTA